VEYQYPNLEHLYRYLEYVMEMCSIYMISCGDSKKIYIGVTKKPVAKRLSEHIQESKNKIAEKKKTTYKNNWINSKLDKGLEVEVHQIDLVPISEFSFWERHYISLFKSWGFTLMNLTEGGEGIFGYKFNEESRLKISMSKSVDVYEVDENCNVLNHFKSTSEAARFHNISKGSLQKHLSGKNKSCASRVFTYSLDSLDPKEIKSIFATMESRHKRSVVQYDTDWNYISEYDSIFSAANSIGLKNDSHIGEACLDKNKTCYGYRWAFKQ
jgi:hypothetical protein